MQKSNIIYLLSALLIILGCTEPFDTTTIDFEDAIVIEATITNEQKFQKVLVSRTTMLEGISGFSGESNANVRVEDTQGNSYIFQETEQGVYISEVEFSAQQSTDYQLRVTTALGNIYSSEIVQLTSETQIENLSVSRNLNNQGEDGVFIYVDSFDPTGTSKYYRYEYEETYKIIAPNWSITDGIIIQEDPLPNPPGFAVALVPKTEEKKTCYNTVNNNEIILTNTTQLMEDRVSMFPVRFINKNNFIISHRYSILVKQFIQSKKSYDFYRTLKELSDIENVFSQQQVGHLSGNIFSESNSNEKVLGYFDVTTISTQRIYFNYTDLFPGENLPPYAIECEEITPFKSVPLPPFGPPFSPLIIALKDGWLYYTINPTPIIDGLEAPWILVPPQCGDCTQLGSNQVPSFWID